MLLLLAREVAEAAMVRRQVLPAAGETSRVAAEAELPAMARLGAAAAEAVCLAEVVLVELEDQEVTDRKDNLPPEELVPTESS